MNDWASLLRGSGPSMFMGMKIFQSPLVQPVPAIQVRDIKLKDGTSILSERFRAETNAWLLDRFGTREVAYMIGGGPMGDGIVMNPKHIAVLKNFV